MREPHSLSAAVLVALVLSISALAQAQQPEHGATRTTVHGIDLYRQGRTEEAIKVLKEVVKKHADDAEAWYYLGLSQYRQEWIAGAREAFEKTVELRPDSADAHAKLAYALVLASESKRAINMAKRALDLGDQSVEAHYAIAEASLRSDQPGTALEESVIALSIKPDFLPALITKSFAHQALQQFAESAESLERLLATSPADPEAKTWRNQIEALRERAAQQPGPPPLAFTTKEVVQKARVVSKPEAGYTEQARMAGATGTVVLRAIFSADGEVTHVLIRKALGYGLTTKAIRAARAIKFTPALKDGKPVSQYITLEYTFNLY